MIKTENHPLLHKTLSNIRQPDQAAAEAVRKRWDSIAKPLRSLGVFEEILVRIAAAGRSEKINISQRALVVFCSDNGIVEEGVTQTGQDVTATVAANLACERATAAILCRDMGVRILPVDVGMISDTGIRTMKKTYGTNNFAKTDAMTYDDAAGTIETGIALAEELAADGCRLFMTGEMGIGNTSTSSAVAAVLLGVPVADITGRGAGLSDEALVHKREVLTRAVEDRKPDPKDPIDVLSKVGGYDIAGMTGLMLGAAGCGRPVILDGFISAVAALAAVRLCPNVLGYLIPSHCSTEPGAKTVLDALHLKAPISADMHPGEGCGALMLLPLLEHVLTIYKEMPTFEQIEIEAYQLFDSK